VVEVGVGVFVQDRLGVEQGPYQGTLTDRSRTVTATWVREGNWVWAWPLLVLLAMS
jgi:hypothetical protein